MAPAQLTEHDITVRTVLGRVRELRPALLTRDFQAGRWHPEVTNPAARRTRPQQSPKEG